MELRSLRYFVAVAEELNFGRAARRLFITQPALSQGIKVLEREVGVPLFARNRQRVALTAAGAELLPAARKLIGHADEVDRLAQHLAATREISLSVSHARSAGVGLPAELTSGFRRAFPHIDVRTTSGHTGSNVERVRTREIDVGFVRPPVTIGEDVTCAVLAYEQVVLAVPAAHRLAAASQVALRDIATEPLVYFPRDTGGLWQSILEAVYSPADAPPIVREEPDEPYMLAAVAEGAGITLLTESSAAILTVPGVVFHHFREGPTVPLGLAWRPDNPNPALPGFLSYARRFAHRPVSAEEPIDHVV